MFQVQTLKQFAPAALLLATTACGATATDPAGPGPTGNNALDVPTYHEDVRPLLAEKCGGCHLEGGLAPFHFESYESTKSFASVIALTVRSGLMPPWGASNSPDCNVSRPFKNDLRLSEAQIALIEAWNTGGAQEGVAPSTLDKFGGELSVLPRIDKELAPEIGFETSGTRDQLRCFVLDPQFDQTTYLQGLSVQPGNEKVVHHVVVYADPEGTASTALANDEGQYDCFGGSGVSSSFLVSAWAPGAVPFSLPVNAGMPLPLTTKFIAQIHYNPLAASAEMDLTKIQLMYTLDAPEYLAGAAFIGNSFRSAGEGEGLLAGPADESVPEFVIPAGATDHTESMAQTIQFRLGNDRFNGAYIYAVANHMHYVGTKMTTTIRRRSASAACGSAEIAPLSACVEANCPNATGFALNQCAQNSCSDTFAGLSALCGSCLQEGVRDGTADAVGACTVPIEPPMSVPEQPLNECLLETPAWDFNWQRSYTYDGEIEDLPFIMAGDVFELKCHYDNSMGNGAVREALAAQGLDAPTEVRLGEETLDEMCLLAVSFLYKRL